MGDLCWAGHIYNNTPYTCHEPKSRITSHLHHIATSDIALSTNGKPDLSQESKTKVFVTKTKGKKEVHSLSLAQTLTLTAVLSPNHLVTNNFRRLCTQFCPLCTTQNSHMCRIRFSLREISWIAHMCRTTLHMQPQRKHDLAPCT